MKIKKDKKTKKELAEIEMITIGDYSWDLMRKVLIIELMNCETEKRFHKIMKSVYLSMGNFKDLEKRRKKLNLKPFSKEEKEKWEKCLK